MRPNPRILLAIPTTAQWSMACAQAIRRYAIEEGRWHLFMAPHSLPAAGEQTPLLESILAWDGDGIICSLTSEQDLLQARSQARRIVNLSGMVAADHGVVRVTTDNYAVGRIAAEHLHRRGASHLGFVGWSDAWFSLQRLTGLRDYCAEHQLDFAAFTIPSEGSGLTSISSQVHAIMDWLRRLPPHAGVFTVQDHRAQVVIEACRRCGIQIPMDLTLLGMDDDPSVCEYTQPTLSSVGRSTDLLGRTAAKTLDRMLFGMPPVTTTILIPPGPVVARESTSIRIHEDATINRCLHLMHERLQDLQGIEALAFLVGQSRRSLEIRFKEVLNCTPLEHLTRLRIERAQRLLKSEDRLSMAEIAVRCGFSTPRHLRDSFRRTLGFTPKTSLGRDLTD